MADRILLNGALVPRKFSPRAMLAELLNLVFPIIRYSPDKVIRKVYKDCWRLAAIYAQWVRWDFPRPSIKKFIFDERRVRKIKSKGAVIINRMVEDILRGEGLGTERGIKRPIFFRALVLPKNVVIPALTTTGYWSRKNRKRIPIDGVKHRLSPKRRITHGKTKIR